jgi:hypothetical protein
MIRPFWRVSKLLSGNALIEVRVLKISTPLISRGGFLHKYLFLERQTVMNKKWIWTIAAVILLGSAILSFSQALAGRNFHSEKAASLLGSDESLPGRGPNDKLASLVEPPLPSPPSDGRLPVLGMGNGSSYYQVVTVSDTEIVIMDVTTGDLYSAKRAKDVKSFNDQPRPRFNSLPVPVPRPRFNGDPIPAPRGEAP